MNCSVHLYIPLRLGSGTSLSLEREKGPRQHSQTQQDSNSQRIPVPVPQEACCAYPLMTEVIGSETGGHWGCGDQPWPLAVQPAGLPFRTRPTRSPTQALPHGHLGLHTPPVCFRQTQLCDPWGCKPTRLLCPWDPPGKNTGVGCLSSCRGSSQPRDQTHICCISCLGRRILYP